MPNIVPRRLRTQLLVGGAIVLALTACKGPSVTTRSVQQATVVAPTGSAAPASDASSQLTADIGFRPANDGFSFPNYGRGPGLTDADVRTL